MSRKAHHEPKDFDKLSHEHEYGRKVLEFLREILEELRGIRKELKSKEPTSLSILQIGGTMPTNNSITAGQSGVFAVNPLPAGSAFASGVLPQWAPSDPTVVLTPSSDGTQCTAAVPPGNTAAFNLQSSYTRQSDGQTITDVVTVTVIPASGPPTGNEPTSLSISQLS